MIKRDKILITGISGYIGSCLNGYLKNYYEIYGIDKKNTQSWIKLKKKNFFQCNLLNLSKLKKIIKKINPNTIVHLAAKSTVNDNIPKIQYNLNNITATKNLIKAMKICKINNLIYSSTAAVYKNKKNLINENDKLLPKSNYGKSKLITENIIKKENLNFIIFRFFNVASALRKPLVGEFHKPETHLIPRSIEKILKNRKIIIYGKNYRTIDGTCIRDYIHIEDICKAILLSIKKLNNKKNNRLVINLGNEKGISNQIIAQTILKKLNKNNSLIFYDKKRLGDAEYLVCNTKLARKTINWQPINNSIKTIISHQLKWSFYLKKKKLI